MNEGADAADPIGRLRRRMVRTAMDRVEFVLIAESGVLEAQALLLCESIRRFAGDYSRCPITVVSPRKTRRPSRGTVRSLDRLGAEYLPLEIDSCCPEYGTSYRVHAAAHVERRPGPPVVVQLDSDTVFLAQPDLDPGECAAAARPVDVKSMCTTGVDDVFDAYWRELCALAGVAYERIPMVTTTVDRRTILASYNGGLVATRRACGLFQGTERIFRRIVAARMRPWGANSPMIHTGTGTLHGAATAYWGTSQAAFSLAAVAGGHDVRVLADTHNIPLHLIDQMPAPLSGSPVHVHYHWLFSAEAKTNPIARRQIDLPPDTVDWLMRRLPLGRPLHAAARIAAAFRAALAG